MRALSQLETPSVYAAVGRIFATTLPLAADTAHLQSRFRGRLHLHLSHRMTTCAFRICEFPLSIVETPAHMDARIVFIYNVAVLTLIDTYENSTTVARL